MSGTKRVLDEYLDRGILRLNGDDDRFDKVIAAANSFGQWLAKHPDNFTACLYSAMDTGERPNDPIRRIAEEHLKANWRSYGGALDGFPHLVFRAMMLDAVQRMTDRDDDARRATAMFIDATLPHVELTDEGAILNDFTSAIRQKVDREAEQSWSVPSEIQLGDFPTSSKEKVKVATGRVSVDTSSLEQDIFKASAPAYADGSTTGGNAQLPPNGQTWVNNFAPLLAEAVTKPLQDLAKSRTVSMDASEIISIINHAVSSFVTQAVDAVAVSTRGLDMRTRLLWWKEAKVSPETGQSYESMSPLDLAVQGAFDYQSYLPATAPPSVIAFLRETIRGLLREDTSITLDEAAKALHGSMTASTITEAFGATSDGALGPVVLAFASGSSATLIDPKTEFDLVDLATVVFRELQGLKSARAIVPFVEETAPVETEESE